MVPLLNYDYRQKAEKTFDYSHVYDLPKDRRFLRFSRLIWFGYDEEGPAVYRKDPATNEVMRIDFER